MDSKITLLRQIITGLNDINCRLYEELKITAERNDSLEAEKKTLTMKYDDIQRETADKLKEFTVLFNNYSRLESEVKLKLDEYNKAIECKAEMEKKIAELKSAKESAESERAKLATENNTLSAENSRIKTELSEAVKAKESAEFEMNRAKEAEKSANQKHQDFIADTYNPMKEKLDKLMSDRNAVDREIIEFNSDASEPKKTETPAKNETNPKSGEEDFKKLYEKTKSELDAEKKSAEELKKLSETKYDEGKNDGFKEGCKFTITAYRVMGVFKKPSEEQYNKAKEEYLSGQKSKKSTSSASAGGIDVPIFESMPMYAENQESKGNIFEKSAISSKRYSSAETSFGADWRLNRQAENQDSDMEDIEIMISEMAET